MTDQSRVMFVCLHGAAKSVVAAELFKRLAGAAGMPVQVTALGLEPDPEVSPVAAAGLLGEGIDVRGFTPRPATSQALADAGRIVAFGCDLATLPPPGVPVDQWTDVPAVADGYAAARAAIAARLPRLLEDCRPANDPRAAP